jgi:hypothetical protein
MNNEIIYLPICNIINIEKSLIDNRSVKLDLTIDHPLLDINTKIIFEQSFFWPLIYADNYKSIFNQAIEADINNLPKTISCLIQKNLTNSKVIGIGKQYEKVVFNLSEMDYFTFQDLAAYAQLDSKVPNKEISDNKKNKI